MKRLPNMVRCNSKERCSHKVSQTCFHEHTHGYLPDVCSHPCLARIIPGDFLVDEKGRKWGTCITVEDGDDQTT